LSKSLAHGDASYAVFLEMADTHVRRHHLDMAEDPLARAVLADPPCLIEPLRRLDLRAADINTVVWATGYAFEFGWINVPVLNTRGEPVHRPRNNRSAGDVFPWSALAGQSQLFSVIGRRGRRRTAGRSYRRASRMIALSIDIG
jgi:hypothetical protein